MLGTVQPIVPGDGDGQEIVQGCRTANGCAARMHAMKVAQIDPGGEPPKSKIVWKYLALQQTLIFRAIEIHNGIAALVAANNLLCALMIARAMLEHVAFAYHAVTEIEKAVKAGDAGALDKAITAAAFATRWEEGAKDSKAINILTLLERLDKGYLGAADEKYMTGFHATLSEATHPNWLGGAGFFGQIDHETRVYHFSTQPPNREATFTSILAGALTILMAEQKVEDMTAMLPAIEKLAG